jgi:hypothetical protein
MATETLLRDEVVKACSDLSTTLLNAESFTQMLYELVEIADVPDLGCGHPASRVQRMYACIGGLDAKLKELRSMEERLGALAVQA